MTNRNEAAPAPQDDALTIADYEEVLTDHRRLVRELDVLLNGDGAAQQASLCDIVSQVRRERIKAQAPAAAGDAREVDPLQGAANWLVQAHGRPSPTVLCRCLMIGYNRAQRLYDAALVAQQGEGGGA